MEGKNPRGNTKVVQQAAHLHSLKKQPFWIFLYLKKVRNIKEKVQVQRITLYRTSLENLPTVVVVVESSSSSDSVPESRSRSDCKQTKDSLSLTGNFVQVIHTNIKEHTISNIANLNK